VETVCITCARSYCTLEKLILCCSLQQQVRTVSSRGLSFPALRPMLYLFHLISSLAATSLLPFNLTNSQPTFLLKMRGFQLREYVRSPDELQLTTLPDPSPKPHEYLIAIHAAATNFFDLLQIRGKYQTQPPFPWVAGAEFSGIVLRAPSTLPNGRTPRFKEGDKVFGATQGAYATKITALEDVLRPVPDGWSFFDAAGMITARSRVKQGAR